MDYQHETVEPRRDAKAEAATLAEAVKQTLMEHVYQPIIAEITAEMRDIQESWALWQKQIGPLLDGKMSQCPGCGEYALSAAMCEEAPFICPHCELNLVWEFHQDTRKYTLRQK